MDGESGRRDEAGITMQRSSTKKSDSDSSECVKDRGLTYRCLVTMSGVGSDKHGRWKRPASRAGRVRSKGASLKDGIHLRWR